MPNVWIEGFERYLPVEEGAFADGGVVYGDTLAETEPETWEDTSNTIHNAYTVTLTVQGEDLPEALCANVFAMVMHEFNKAAEENVAETRPVVIRSEEVIPDRVQAIESDLRRIMERDMVSYALRGG